MVWRYGIDTVAHETTLEEHGKTIAVLGNGFNHIFPKENKKLFKKIIDNSGLIISEYSLEQKATSERFLERNRIVSGIALGVLVIESAHRSGTSVTAKLAKEQERKVFAIPHNIDDLHGVGNNRLIHFEIAKLVSSTEDIMEEFPDFVYKKYERIKCENTKDNKKRHKKVVKKENKKIDVEIKRKVCKNKEYSEIYKLIGKELCTINEICKKSNKSISEINRILIMLEIEGYIEKIAGGYRCITSK